MALNLTLWNNEQNPVNKTIDHLMDDLLNDDMREGLMYEPCTMDDVLDGTQPAENLILDAIISQYTKLTAKMNIMQRAMSRSGATVKSFNDKGEEIDMPLTVVGYQISDPFMRLGTANVVALFELSDGQTISIYFHNPDVTPKKITPQDEVISFKWLLNKKDVTIVVAPERGKDINVLQVATRIMKIAAKNSAAFVRQNKNRAERIARVTALRERVEQKEKELKQKVKKIDELKYLKAQEEVDQLLAEEEAQKQAKIEAEKPDTKIERITLNWSEGDGNIARQEFGSLDELQTWFLQTYSPEYMSNMRANSYSKNQVEFDLRHKDGSKETYQDRIDVGLGNGDFDPNREHFMETDDEKYKERLKARGVRKFNYNPALTSLIKNTQTEISESQENPPIVITGKEFGEFDTSTPEGIESLRSKVDKSLRQLIKSKDKVFSKALNADVYFSGKGIDKYISFSANPVKLYLAAKIKEIIANGKIFKESEDRYDNTAQKNKLTYHYLKTEVKVDENTYGARIVVREDHNGNYHWDLQVKDDVESILDGINENGTELLLATNPGLFNTVHQAQSELQPNNTTLLDDVQVKNIKNAIEYAKSLDSELIIDSVSPVRADLENLLSLYENNLPINVKKGNIDQAKLESEHILSIRNALTILDSVDNDRYVLNLFVFDKDGNEIKDSEEEDIEFKGDKEIVFSRVTAKGKKIELINENNSLSFYVDDELVRKKSMVDITTIEQMEKNPRYYVEVLPILKESGLAGMWNNQIGLTSEEISLYLSKKEGNKKAIDEKASKNIQITLSTRGMGDYSPVSWSGSVDVPNDQILRESRNLLNSEHDVDNKNQSDNELLGLIESAKAKFYAQKEQTLTDKKEAEEYINSVSENVIKAYNSVNGDPNKLPDNIDHPLYWAVKRYAEALSLANNTQVIANDIDLSNVVKVLVEQQKQQKDKENYEKMLEDKANRKRSMSEEMKAEFIALLNQYGFSEEHLNDIPVGSTSFYVEKEENKVKIDIEAAFSGSQVERHKEAYYDFTVTGDKSAIVGEEDDDRYAYFYTNSFEDALKWANKWLDENKGDQLQPTESSQEQSDRQFLQDVIDDKVDVFASNFNTKLSEIAERLQNSHADLVQQAANVYVTKMTEKAKQAQA
ncbi:hypothetical protein [Rodentibacter pneumotropicus]|uniref:Defence against restriction A N-terminal domain-containing protein n=1 Tax=Rodentibacter pneumotropicus TaxID=758 RepID=A0A4S2PPQ9_9PAST|nr:hypothetical protein [Rodentibacter pneumotropicus]THA05534.1 hypothetical protein D3M77_09430 [Rodentibacter pneumotropicus]THA16330.1 hypothetical protein D3M76_03430 [Rodentibacter pneumotropicus]